MKRLATPLAITFLAAALVSCAGESRFRVFGSPLESQVAQWTRTAKLYDRFDTILIADAIYNGQPLRAAWVEETAKARRLDEAARQQTLARQTEENAALCVIYLAVYTADSQWNAFAGDKARWTVELASSTGAARPASIKKIEREDVPWFGALPFDPTFRVFYRVEYPRAAAPQGPITLTLSSLLGSVEFVWRQI